MRTLIASCFALALLAGCAPGQPLKGAGPSATSVPVHAQTSVAGRGHFYVGGRYVGEGDRQLMSGQMYVEVLTPHVVKRPYPLVLIHGAAQTATNWMGTPDGRKGWAEYFVEQGYVVYMVDQPMRGRSAWHPGDGPTRMFTAAALEAQFTATDRLGPWPQAKLHTQWPGDGPRKGMRGDPVFDAFYASQVESLASNTETQLHNQRAGAALLDRIGPAILVTHSQAGPYGWLIADARPQLVKGIVAIEPSGPPFENSTNATGKARPWGPTDVPLTYDPPVANPAELQVQREGVTTPERFACWMQKAPVRRLPNLARTPVLVMVAEASYHAVYDHCTADYLQQAGVPTELMRLENKGLRGNGHMVMIERNSLEIAGLVDTWISGRVR